MTAEMTGLILALGSLMAALVAIGKLMLDRRTADADLLTRKEEAISHARNEHMEAVDQLVKNVSTSYTSIIEQLRHSHSEITEGLHREISEVRERVVRLEETLRERDGIVLSLNTTVERLNETLRERDTTIRRIRDQLSRSAGVPVSLVDEAIGESVAPERRTSDSTASV